ncbi:MAG TPA: elongation factor 1-beta [Methanocorpusculum sp.]|nr:elongation factor 1-beta [Methanocorpusculum sp.]
MPEVRVPGSVNSMGDVAVILKIMPESPEVDLKNLEADIRGKITGIQDVKIEPIGFGLSAVKVALVTTDDAGAEDKIKGMFTDIAGIESVEIESLTLL